MEKEICPVCKNEYGFVTGTCIECGYNHLSHEFKFIKVWISDLKQVTNQNGVDLLIDEHFKNKYKKNKEKE